MGRLQKNARRSWKLVKETSREFWEDNVLALGAGLAYYSAFSIVPILVIVIAIAGVAFGEEEVRSEIHEQVRGLVGSEGAGQIQTMMEGASAHPKTGKVAALLGLVTLVLGATGVSQGCFSRDFCSSGKTTDPKSTSFTAPSASPRMSGGAASRASASMRC